MSILSAVLAGAAAPAAVAVARRAVSTRDLTRHKGWAP